MHAQVAKDRGRDDERTDGDSEEPGRAGSERRGEREVERHGGAGGDDDRPARLGALDVWSVAQHAGAYGTGGFLARAKSRSTTRNEVRILRMALEILLHVRTARDDVLPLAARVIEGGRGEHRGVALSLECRRDFGMHEIEVGAAMPIDEH